MNTETTRARPINREKVAAAERAYRLAVRCSDCTADPDTECCYRYYRLQRAGIKAALRTILS